MSPSVADFQSPISSKSESQSERPQFFPNRNPSFDKPPQYSSFASSFTDSTSFNSLNIGTATAGAFKESFSSISESRVSSGESKVVSNSRSRPRLVKVRKHNATQRARSKLATNRGNDVSETLNINKSQCANTVNFLFGGQNNSDYNDKSSAVSNSMLFNGGHGSTFGVNESGLFGDLGVGNKEPDKEGDSDFDGLGKYGNFLFASDNNVVNSTSSFSSEAKAKTDAKNMKREEGTKPGFLNADKVDYVFGATDKDSLSNSNLKKKKAKATSFVFGAGGNGFISSLNSKQVGIDGSIINSFSFENKNSKSTSNTGNTVNVGFVFGAGKSSSASVTDTGTPQSRVNADKFSFPHIGKTNVDGETEHCNSKVNGVFVVGSGSKQSSHISEGDDELKRKSNTSGSVSKSRFSSGYEDSGNLGNAFNSHAYKLSDDIQKINIHDSEISNGVGTCKSSSIGSFSNPSDNFVFSSDNRTYVPLTRNTAFTSDQYQNANGAVCRNGQAVKNTDVANDISCEEKVFGLGNNENNVSSFGDSVENTIPDTVRNKETKYETGQYGGQDIPSFSSFETRGKENKSINLTENGMDGKQNLGNQPSLNFGVHGSFYTSSSSSMGFGYQPFDSVYEAPTGDRADMKDKEFTFPSTPFQGPKGDGAEKKDKEFMFTSTPVELRPTFNMNMNMPANLSYDDGAVKKDKDFVSMNSSSQPGPYFTGFNTPNINTPANLHARFSMKSNVSISNVSTGGRRLKKTRGKLRQYKVSRELNSQRNEAPVDSGSPMDFSPYQEASCADASHSQSSIFRETANGLADAGRIFDEKVGDGKRSEENKNGVKDYYGTETQINTKPGRFSNNVSAGTGTETRASLSTEECDNNFQYCSASQCSGERRYSFNALSSTQNNISASTHRSVKKYRMKIGHGSDSTSKSCRAEFASSSVKFADVANSSIKSDIFQAQRADILNTQSKGEHKSFMNNKPMKQDLTEAETIEACEKWRISGNQAYRRGSLSKAENFYTKCINAITQMKTPECCIEPLVLCYSNRAAARMCLGRIREALRDCKSAALLDSNFQKVQMRAANCHLVLGEVEDAMLYFNKCLEPGVDVCLDRRIMIEAADGLQKCQKVINCTSQSAELLQQRTSDAASSALSIIKKALSTSSHSEKLLEMEAEALCMLQKYEEVVQLCEQTLGFAEKNFTDIDTADQLANTDGSKGIKSDIRLWRWRLMSKSYFHMGRLEASLGLIKQQEQLRYVDPRYKNKGPDSSVTSAATVRDLLELKNAGNKAFKYGEHAKAIEHYTVAISSSGQSRPFAAVCFCNRAAAYQALGNISDAIADCSLAIALDENYGKALSRRATLHEMIRDYEQAANDLQKFINLQKQLNKKTKESDSPLGTGGIRDYTKEARSRLSSVERKAKKEIPLDFYLLLGIKASDTTSDIKKAYHRAALKHHPDKAGQLLVRTESVDGGPLRKEIAEKIHLDADRLFKMIGEAYAVLSDNNKRAKYDREEEIRKDSDKISSSGRESNVYSSPFESRSSREYGREWRTYGGESWKTYGKSHSRW